MRFLEFLSFLYLIWSKMEQKMLHLPQAPHIHFFYHTGEMEHPIFCLNYNSIFSSTCIWIAFENALDELFIHSCYLIF